MNTLGENLKKYRLKEKYMQETVAEYINKSSRTYSRYETGTLKPDIDTLIMLREAKDNTKNSFLEFFSN